MPSDLSGPGFGSGADDPEAGVFSEAIPGAGPALGLAPATGEGRASLGSAGAGRFGDTIVRTLCLVCAVISVLTTLGIVIVLGKEAFAFFREVSPAKFYFGTEWSPQSNPASFGVLPLVSGTFLITVGSALIALPMGLLSAVFLSEYARPRIRTLLKPVLELLAGVPTVVYGYFALQAVTPFLRRFVEVDYFNAAAGAIVVGIMVLPLVSSLCEDALRAVPKAMREGAYGLGATQAEVTTKTVIPAALSGIMASFILALSRAIGETMAVTIAAGQTANLTLNPARSIETMTAYIVNVSRGDTQNGSLAFRTLFAVGATLFVTTLLMNILAQALVKRLRLRYE